MNGAESLLAAMTRNGIEVCFANPGTSEMHFVAALDRVEGMRGILGLFEGVVTGPPTAMPACWIGRPAPFFTSGPASPTACRTSTTPCARNRRSSTSSATTPPIIGISMRP